MKFCSFLTTIQEFLIRNYLIFDFYNYRFATKALYYPNITSFQPKKSNSKSLFPKNKHLNLPLVLQLHLYKQIAVFVTKLHLFIGMVYKLSTLTWPLQQFLLQQRIEGLQPMNKRITDIRIQKELQSIEKEPIPSVLLHRDSHLVFHFVFYNLDEDFRNGFYHGLLELPEDYPFSPPKISFLTNNGRFEVGKSICTSFTHYHKETWSSSWNIRTILLGMISFMYSNEHGIGGVFQNPQKRKSLAAKSLQQNLKNEKFLQFFKQKLVAQKIVPIERIEELIKKNEKSKRRQRERSQATHTDQIFDIPQILEAGELLREINEPVGIDSQRNKETTVGLIEEDTINRKRGLPEEQNDQEREELQELEMLEKKRKMEITDLQNEEVLCLERQRTIQDNERQ